MAFIESGPEAPVEAEYERGVVIDQQGFFVAAYQWVKGTPRPKLNPKGTPPSKRLKWLTSAEAIADPKANGKWDEVNLVWLTPSTPAYEVLERPDKPGFWTLQSTRLVWPENLPALAPGRKWVFVTPPQTRARRPIWADDADTWILPAHRMAVDADGVCLGVQSVIDEADTAVPPGGRAIDPDGITVTDEIGEVRRVAPGDKLKPDNTIAEARPPRYRRVPVRILRKVLQDTGNLAAFVAFIEGKGYTVDRFEGIRTVSLNNALLREFVLAQGFTLKQAHRALQKAAEAELEAEEQELDDLGREK